LFLVSRPEAGGGKRTASRNGYRQGARHQLGEVNRKGVEFPNRRELIDKIVIVVGLPAEPPACHLLTADGAPRRIAPDIEIAAQVGKSVINGQLVRPRPGIAECYALNVLVAMVERICLDIFWIIKIDNDYK
jgi:hypothetical protein